MAGVARSHWLGFRWLEQELIIIELWQELIIIELRNALGKMPTSPSLGGDRP